jgi:uncharacterized protein YbaR (Trm112 family)
MDFLWEVVRCPRSGRKLHGKDGCLLTEDGKISYRMENGIPVLLAEEAVEVAR